MRGAIAPLPCRSVRRSSAVPIGPTFSRSWASSRRAIGPSIRSCCERLADRAALGDFAPPADQPWRAAIEPLADGWAGQLLLARAAAYAMHRDQVSPLFRFDTMAPLIDQPPYVRASKELVAAAKAGGFAEQRLDAGRSVWTSCAPGAARWRLPGRTPSRRQRRTRSDRQDPLCAAARRDAGLSLCDQDAGKTSEPTRTAACAAAGRSAGRMAAVTQQRRRPQARPKDLSSGWPAAEVSQQIGPHSSATTLFRNRRSPTRSRWTRIAVAEASRNMPKRWPQSLSLPAGLSRPAPCRAGSTIWRRSTRPCSKPISGEQAAERSCSTEAAKQWSRDHRQARRREAAAGQLRAAWARQSCLRTRCEPQTSSAETCLVAVMMSGLCRPAFRRCRRPI